MWFRADKGKSFSVDQASKQHGIAAKDLEVALKYLRAPRIVERKGEKHGYWSDRL